MNGEIFEFGAAVTIFSFSFYLVSECGEFRKRLVETFDTTVKKILSNTHLIVLCPEDVMKRFLHPAENEVDSQWKEFGKSLVFYNLLATFLLFIGCYNSKPESGITLMFGIETFLAVAASGITGKMLNRLFESHTLVFKKEVFDIYYAFQQARMKVTAPKP